MWWSNINFWLQRFMMMFWNFTNENLNFICDLELILGLHAILPFWTVCIPWSSLHNFTTCLFVILSMWQIFAIKALLGLQWFLEQIWWLCIWHELNALETFTNKDLLMRCCLNLSGEEVDYLIIEFFYFKYFA
jgi:hypothetical protein